MQNIHSPVFDILPVGRENAVSLSAICKTFGLDNRQARKEIERERRAGAVILSSTEPPGGYYRAANVDELKRFTASMQSRAASISAACTAAKQQIADMERARR